MTATRRADYLFSDTDFRSYLEQRRVYLKEDIDDAAEEYLLGVDPREWASFLADRHHLKVPVLEVAAIEAEDAGEMQVDVSREWQSRAIFDRTTPTYISGRRIVVHVPFTGERHLFGMQASTHSLAPPRAIVARDDLQLVFEYPHDRRPNIKSETDAVVAGVEQGLQWLRDDALGYNGPLESFALQTIEARRERVLGDHRHLQDLGIPVRRREDAPKTYAAPGITRKPAPQPPRRPSAPRALEPTLVDDFYAHICQLTRSMAHSMERTPQGYASWDEERLRDSLLVMLNTHYEGQAMGEVFQGAGKTDILVRIEDRNVFIAECKWWSGAAAFSKALNQLFGYATWRDTKLALVVFVRAQGLTNVIDKARETLHGHAQFVGLEEPFDESELRARMTWLGDADREATLNVLFVHLPPPA